MENEQAKGPVGSGDGEAVRTKGSFHGSHSLQPFSLLIFLTTPDLQKLSSGSFNEAALPCFCFRS